LRQSARNKGRGGKKYENPCLTWGKRVFVRCRRGVTNDIQLKVKRGLLIRTVGLQPRKKWQVGDGGRWRIVGSDEGKDGFCRLREKTTSPTHPGKGQGARRVKKGKPAPYVIWQGKIKSGISDGRICQSQKPWQKKGKKYLCEQKPCKQESRGGGTPGREPQASGSSRKP